MLKSNISSTCPRYVANFDAVTAEISLPVWGTPPNFNGFRVLPSLLQRRRLPEVNETLHDVWQSPGLVGLHYIYTFSGVLALTEFCSVQNSLYVQVLRSPILAALLHGTPAASVSYTLRRRTRNGITELSQRAPPIFGRAAITLGIGPHSSFDFVFSVLVKRLAGKSISEMTCFVSSGYKTAKTVNQLDMWADAKHDGHPAA